MNAEDRKIMRDEITAAVQVAVKTNMQEMFNGKLDPKSSTYILKDIQPILDEYHEKQIRDAYLLKTGERIKWTTAVILALGALYTILKGIIKI